MSILNKAIEGFAKYEVKNIESLDIDVRVAKLSVKQAKEFEAWQKRSDKDNKGLNTMAIGVKTLQYVVSEFFSDEDGKPLLEEEDAKEVIESLPVAAIEEFTNVFQEVNGLGDLSQEELEEALKKK